MKTWSHHVIFKLSVDVFSIALLCIYQGKIAERFSLIGGDGLTALGNAILRALKGQGFQNILLKSIGFWLKQKATLPDVYKGVFQEISSSCQRFFFRIFTKYFPTLLDRNPRQIFYHENYYPVITRLLNSNCAVFESLNVRRFIFII